jgi:hypothetical protein
MSAAQIALALLTATLIVMGGILLIFEEVAAGWTCLGIGFFGYLMIVSMVTVDARTKE